MKQQPQHGLTVGGIRIRFHPSWLIIVVLIALSLKGYFQLAHPAWNGVLLWGTALTTAALFFVSVILHELAHSLVARACGLPVKQITLFVFGGVSQVMREPSEARTELWIALAGPATSLALGGILLLAAHLMPSAAAITAVFWWLGSINLFLAAFNLIPGFPLDGGRVLRAILWSASKDFIRATRWATNVGKAVALLFILNGLIKAFFRGQAVEGIWLAFIGWFLLNAAEQSWRHAEVTDVLERHKVGDLASPYYTWVKPDETLEEYFQHAAETQQNRPSLVIDDETLVGVIAPLDLRGASRQLWPEVRVRDIMVPRDQVAIVAPNDGLRGALEKMANANLVQLPVIENGIIRGVILRERIVQLLQQLSQGQLPER